MKIALLHNLQIRSKPWRRRLRARWLTRTGRREDAIVVLARSLPGMFRQDEIRLLYQTACSAAGPGDIAEIGSWKGRTSVVIGWAIKDAGHRDCKLYAIDHHAGSEEHQDRIAREGSTLSVFRNGIQSAGVADVVEEMVMKSLDGARALAERGVRLRMVFIDGAHDEDSVRKDIRAFVPLLAPGAIIAMHDCEPEGGFPGVWKAYQSELRARILEVSRASSLLVTRLKN